MTNRTHLEEALEFLINEEGEQATASFHKFIIGSAKTIHESLMAEDAIDDDITEGDEKVEETKDEEVTEAKDEEVTEEAETDTDDKVEEGMNEYFSGGDLGEAGDEVAPDMELDAAPEMDETVTVPLSDLEELKAKFEEITAAVPELADDDLGAELGAVDDVATGDEFAAESNPFAEGEENKEEAVEEAVSHGDGVQSTAGTDANGGGTHGKNASIAHNSDVGNKDDSKLSETAEFDFDLTEDDFLDLEEGLKSVSVSMGGEQGGVKYAGEETNTKSTVADKDKSDVKADPKTMISKQDEHGTYKRESAPSNDKLPHSGENNHDKAEGTPGRSSVSGHGGLESNSGNDGGEQGGKKFAGKETNTKSIIGSAGSRNEK